MSKESYKKWYEANKDHARKTKREAMRRYREINPEKHREQSNPTIRNQQVVGSSPIVGSKQKPRHH